MNEIPTRLHAAYDWTAAAGELEELAALTGKALKAYCRESAANNAENGTGDVTSSDLADLAEWLRAVNYR